MKDIYTIYIFKDMYTIYMVGTYTMNTYVVLTIERKNDVTIIVKLAAPSSMENFANKGRDVFFMFKM